MTRPADELATLPFSARLADSLIKGAGQQSLECEVCQRRCDINASYDSMAPGWADGLAQFCRAKFTKQVDVERLERKLVSSSLYSMTITPLCRNVLGDSTQLLGLLERYSSLGLSTTSLHITFPTVADALSQEFPPDKCPGGCSNHLMPLCKAGQCVRPSCADAKPLCDADTQAGYAVRGLCGKTCGCHKGTGALFLNGNGFGCAPSCQSAMKKRTDSMPCQDAAVGSKTLTALAHSIIEFGKRNALDDFVSLGKSLRVRGCATVRFDSSLRNYLCGDFLSYDNKHFKGLRAVCKRSCSDSCLVEDADVVSSP